MTKDKVEELKEKFDTLIELGVVFRYGSEDIEQGEITNIEFTEDDTVKLELDEFTEEEVDLQNFIENHIKEGNNYHTWNVSREFANLLDNNIDAKEFYESLSYSNKRKYIRWITSAKKEETKIKRMDEAIIKLKDKIKIK